MSTSPRRLAAAGALALALLIAPALGGCGLVQGAIENATGTQLDLPGASVPKDFPSEVPLAQGQVIFGLGAGKDADKAWNVTIKVDSGAFAAITSQLQSAGFTLQNDADKTYGDNGGLFTSDKYSVLVVVSDDGSNGTVANYTVTTVTK
jgi:hypothetical protein